MHSEAHVLRSLQSLQGHREASLTCCWRADNVPLPPVGVVGSMLSVVVLLDSKGSSAGIPRLYGKNVLDQCTRVG